jgi:hypothetical protein
MEISQRHILVIFYIPFSPEFRPFFCKLSGYIGEIERNITSNFLQLWKINKKHKEKRQQEGGIGCFDRE